MKIYNPDKNKIYHVWHYCLACEETFIHSQRSCDWHKRHKYLTFPIEQNIVEIVDCCKCKKEIIIEDKGTINRIERGIGIEIICDDCLKGVKK